MADSPIVSLVLEDLLVPEGEDRASRVAALVALRQADAMRVGASVRCFESAPLDPKADVAGFVSVFEETEAALGPDALSDAGTRLRGIGRFRLRNVMPGSETTSDAAGMLVGITDCSDGARLGEFNAWYDDCHAADVMRSGKYQRGRRFESLDGDANPLGSFLALYETSGEEPATFKSYLAWPARDRSRCEVFVVRQVFTLRRIG